LSLVIALWNLDKPSSVSQPVMSWRSLTLAAIFAMRGQRWWRLLPGQWLQSGCRSLHACCCCGSDCSYWSCLFRKLDESWSKTVTKMGMTSAKEYTFLT
jgi:hypothetical protein